MFSARDCQRQRPGLWVKLATSEPSGVFRWRRLAAGVILLGPVAPCYHSPSTTCDARDPVVWLSAILAHPPMLLSSLGVSFLPFSTWKFPSHSSRLSSEFSLVLPVLTTPRKNKESFFKVQELSIYRALRIFPYYIEFINLVAFLNPLVSWNNASWGIQCVKNKQTVEIE